MKNTAFIEQLTSEQRSDLLAGLRKKAKADAISMAFTLSAALTANLRVAGRYDLADLSERIQHELESTTPSKN